MFWWTQLLGIVFLRIKFSTAIITPHHPKNVKTIEIKLWNHKSWNLVRMMRVMVNGFTVFASNMSPCFYSLSSLLTIQTLKGEKWCSELKDFSAWRLMSDFTVIIANINFEHVSSCQSLLYCNCESFSSHLFMFQQDGIPESFRINGEFLFLFFFSLLVLVSWKHMSWLSCKIWSCFVKILRI